MFVRLTVKLAEMVDGIDLSHHTEGEIIELADREGNLLIAEGWAERVNFAEERVACVARTRPDVAAATTR